MKTTFLVVLAIFIPAFVAALPAPGAQEVPTALLSLSDCPAEAVAGEPCDPDNCEECGACDWYMLCRRTGPTTGVWEKHHCDSNSVGGVVLVDQKLFWNRDGNVHGGQCVAWGALNEQLKPIYLSDPDCKPICEYQPDGTCVRKYTFKNPDFDANVWDTPAIPLSCQGETKWDQAVKTCVLCRSGDDCSC